MHVGIWEDHFKQREQKMVKMGDEKWEINWACLKNRRKAGVTRADHGERVVADELRGTHRVPSHEGSVGHGQEFGCFSKCSGKPLDGFSARVTKSVYVLNDGSSQSGEYC